MPYRRRRYGRKRKRFYRRRRRRSYKSRVFAAYARLRSRLEMRPELKFIITTQDIPATDTYDATTKWLTFSDNLCAQGLARGTGEGQYSGRQVFVRFMRRS